MKKSKGRGKTGDRRTESGNSKIEPSLQRLETGLEVSVRVRRSPTATLVAEEVVESTLPGDLGSSVRPEVKPTTL